MKYEKPLVVHSTPAVSAVQHTDPPTKGPAGMDGGNEIYATVGAYEADE